MDRITSTLLSEFSKTHSIEKMPEDRRFEYFAAYLVTNRFYNETFDISEIVTGQGNDTGIDAIAIIVNGALVTDSEIVRELSERNGYIDATFVFVQAERSSSFDTSKIGQFGFGVSDFFKENPSLPQNKEVAEAHAIMTEIYNRSNNFKRGNPNCKLFYVTTGKWTGDVNLDIRRKAVVADLEELRIFSEVDFSPVDVETIHKLYRQTKNAISREFTFSSRTVIPEIPGVVEAHLGLLPAKEFLSLIQDENGDIIKSIFYDNVRDWQDFNPVNTEIKETLMSDKLRLRFALMNNGITIIAKKLFPTGNKFHIEDYQIVNGCQTSHVIFDQRNSLDDSIMVPLRLISTQDEEIISSIIKATNRQTEVKAEQLIALSDFQKKLEAFFQSFDDSKKLYYERRSRQYNDITTGIDKNRIITPTNLIRAYASIFLEEPHRTTRNYKGLLDMVGKNIFGENHRLEPYYVSAFAFYRIEQFFRSGAIIAPLKVARYHILLSYRLIMAPGQLPRLNSNEMQRYCDTFLETLTDVNKAEQNFAIAVEAVENVAAGNYDRDHIRTQSFTEQLKN